MITRYKIINYMTFEELLSSISDETLPKYIKLFTKTQFESFLSNIGVSPSMYGDLTAEGNIFLELFSRIYRNHYLDYAIYYEKDEEIPDKIGGFIYSIITRYYDTLEKFEQLIKFYKNQGDSLLNDTITSYDSDGYINDTPQNSYTNINQDEHMNNYHKDHNESKTTLSNLDKYQMLKESLSRTWETWLKDFNGLFIRKENV